MSEYNNILSLKVYVKKCKLAFVCGILGMIICSIISTPIPYLTGYIIDKILIPHKSYIELYKIISILAVLYLLKFFITIVAKNFFIKVQNYVVNEIRTSMLGKVIDLPMSFLDKNQKGYILGRISECGNIGNLFSPVFINTFLSIFDLIFSVIMMFTLNYKLAIFVLIMIPIYFFTVKHSSNKLSQSTKLMLETASVLSGETYEVLNGLEEIKILNGKKFQLTKFITKLKKMINNTTKQNKQIIFFMENISLVNNLSSILILLFSGILILNNQLTIGIYTAFIGYMNKTFTTTSGFASLEMTIKPVCVSIERIHEFLNMNNEDSQNLEVIEEDIESISIQNLSFKYDINSPNIINHLNFNINKGDKILIKGENGVGKSTLIKMLLGLYSSTEGNIFINNKNYNNIDKKSIRGKIGVVSQHVFLFRGSVLYNILYGQINKSMEDVLALIKEYDLEKYMEGFENGLETQINQNDSGISGGQIQIIAFLRAIVTKKSIIILDEATSNIDMKTREIIMKILSEKNICDILIVISHQEDGMEFINKTLLLKKGD